MIHNTQEQSNTIARFIDKTKFLFLGLLSLIIIGGGGYLLFQNSTNNKNNALRTLIEASNDEYTKIVETNAINKINENLELSKVDALVLQFQTIIDNNSNIKSFEIQEVYYRLATLYVLQKKFEDALSNLDNAIAIKPNSYLMPKILAFATSIAEELGNITKAQEYLLSITDNYPNSIEMAHAQFTLGRIAEIQDLETGDSTAQGYYLELVNNELWKESSWGSLAKSRLALLGYTDINNETENTTTTSIE